MTTPHLNGTAARVDLPALLRAVGEARGLTWAEHSLLYTLLRRVDWRTGAGCSAAVASLAAEISMSARTARTAIKKLEERGVLRVARVKGGVGTDGRPRTNQISIVLPALAALAEPGSTCRVDPASAAGLEHVNPATAAGSTRHHTSVNPAGGAIQPGSSCRQSWKPFEPSPDQRESAREPNPATAAGLRIRPHTEAAARGMSGRWSIDELKRIASAYPRASTIDRVLKLIDNAIEQEADSGRVDPFGYVLSQTQTFAKSWAGQRGQFTMTAANWFRDGGWQGDPAQWADPGNPDKPTRPRPDYLAIANGTSNGKAQR